jgi:ribonuclease-3
MNNIDNKRQDNRQKMQERKSEKQSGKYKMLKVLGRVWRDIQFWKPTKYQELLGFREGNTRLYDIAFVHSSMSIRDKKGRLLNNERLEFLGDAVLETVMSEKVYTHYPNQKEGFLSSSRALLVRRKTTNELGDKMGLRKYVVARKKTADFANMSGNLFEALVGAIYIDKGYEVAKDFILRSYTEYINMEKLLRNEKNYKSMLLEWCQKERKEFYYELVEETRVEDNKIRFQTRVVVDGRPMGLGVGNSKRESEQAAAKQAVQTLKD